jgi:trimethylamine:corrinoid methyltransferase-like protein
MERGSEGSFLDTEHTLRFFRDELFDPEISNRTAYERWQAQGSRPAHERAARKARVILEQHHPERELDPKVVNEIYGVVEGEDRRSP